MRKNRRSIAALVLAMILASQSVYASAADLGTGAEPTVIVSEVSGNDETEEISADVSENGGEEKTDVTSNDEETEEVSEEEDVWYDIPENYVVTADEMAVKEDMVNTIDSMELVAEGEGYAADRVFALVDSEEDAEVVADAYNSEIVSYEEGVVVLDIPDQVTVAEAVAVGADTDLAMPVVYPDFYRYADEVEEEETIEDLEDEDNDLNVASIYSDPYLLGNSSYYQWHHEVVGSAYAWKKGYTGSGIKVAVLDTGVLTTHTELSVAAVKDFTSSSSGATDKHGHGTHCSGIIAAKANGSMGVGVAPGVTLYGGKVLGDNGSGSDSGIISGINWAVNTCDVDVISMSLGGISYSSAYQSALNNAYNNGTVVVAAAGNDGGCESHYPASYAHVISVAATDKTGKRADFSNYGPTVDLSAPGVSIWSLGITGNSAVAEMSGTSQATPVVAGEIAVVLSAQSNFSSLKDKNGNLLTGGARVDAVEKLMKSKATGCGSGMGKGIVNLAKVFGMTQDTATPVAPTITLTPSADYQKVTVTITSSSVNTIYYTTDGKNPSYSGTLLNGTKYTGSFTISPSTAAKITVKAIEVNSVGKVSKVASKAVTLKPYVTSVTVKGSNTYAAPGKQVQFTATCAPTYATTKTVTWSVTGSSTDTACQYATIDKKGKLTIKKDAPAGTVYTVKAVANYASGTVSGTASVTVKSNYVASVKFNAKTIGITRSSSNVTETLWDKMTATSTDPSTISLTASDFTYTSANTKVATVSDAGVVTAVGPGTAKITAKAKDTSGKSTTVTIKVTQMVTSVSLDYSKNIHFIAPGTTSTLKAIVSPANASNKGLVWSVEPYDADSTGVSINAKTGKITATKTASGKYTVKATAKDGSEKYGSYIYMVEAGKVTGYSTITKPDTIFRTSGTFSSRTSTTWKIQINGTDCYKNYVDARVTVGNPNLVDVTYTVSSDGTITVTIKAKGTATGTSKITVSSVDGSNKSISYTVTVAEPTTAVNIAPASAGVGNYCVQGKSLQLAARLTGEGKLTNSKVNWSINTNGYSGVTVNNKGKVSATKSAEARSETYYVRATAADGSGAYADYEVTVLTPSTYAYFSGVYSWYTYYLYTNSSYEVTLGLNGNTFYWPSEGGYYYGSFYVSSSNPAIMSASSDGRSIYIQTYGKKGKVKLTVKTAGGSSASINFIVK